MSQDRDGLPSNKKEGQGPLHRVNNLAPLLDVVLQFLELLLKVFGVIK
jgi:hypothetical protein